MSHIVIAKNHFKVLAAELQDWSLFIYWQQIDNTFFLGTHFFDKTF